MKKNKNFNVKICYIGLILLFLIVLLLFVEMKKISNNIYDTFYANHVYFKIEDAGLHTYRINFDLLSSQRKEYNDKSLDIYFKCYNSNGNMIDDGVYATFDNPNNLTNLSYVGAASSDYDQISYCELNYVNIR